MHRPMVLFVCVFVLYSAPRTVLAQNQTQSARMRFEEMDRDRNGKISRDEWRGSDRSFEVHDWNGDGELSGPEVAIGGRRTTSVDQSDHMPSRLERYLSWTAEGFTSLDHNRDRKITPNEWHYDRETFRRVDRDGNGSLSRAEFLGAADWDDDRGDNFDDLDVDNDGRVERDEWHGSRAVFDQLDRNRDGVLSRYEVVGNVDTINDTWDQFDNLDFNRNGSIDRTEWHGSTASFNRRDLNRDGVLSRREFEETEGVGESELPSASRTITVNARQRWTDTGLEVRAGDTITFDASGTIRMSDNTEDVATPAGSRTGRRAPDAPVLNQLAGALIGRIGDYGPIFIGGRTTLVAPASGRLLLGVNDDHLPDNSGEFHVELGIRRR